MKSRFVLAALLGAACVFSSCGGDDDPAPMQPVETPPVRNHPDSLLTSWFERAYESEDDDLYSEMLDPGFTFVFLPADRDSFGLELNLDGNGAWGKTSDVGSTENMFDDGTVSDILLELSVTQTRDYAGGDCVDCKEIETNVNLHVVTNPSGASEPLDLVVDGPQTFILKPV
ncbi:MAG TPA: hypothetical protein VJW75_02125, partial [Candidatus Eisenbacteria bacterium]|nr:hypothetical protein [Candidatus Eisenbacteria bacterium]